MDELGLLDEFLQRPHQRLRGDRRLVRRRACPARRLPRPAGALRVHRDDAAVGVPRFPRRARRGSCRRSRCGCAPTSPGLIEDGGRVVGVRGTSRRAATSRSAPSCTVGCDGRHSTVRAAAGLAVEDLGAPIDVLWFRVGARSRPSSTTAWRGSRPATSSSRSTAATTGSARSSSPRAAPRRCARGRSRRSAPRSSRPRRCSRAHIADDVRSWDDVKLLTVAVDRLRAVVEARACSASATRRTRCRRSAASASTWRSRTPSPPPTCSPAKLRDRHARPRRPRRGAAAPRSGRPRRRRRRRSAIQNNVLVPVLSGANAALEVPLPMRVADRRAARCSALLARLLGMGVRPEHVRSPAA